MHKIIGMLARGGVGVLPTDTLYGLVGSAFSEKAVARIYRLRRRDLKKPMIILIGSLAELARFGVKVSPSMRGMLAAWWPGKVSVVLQGTGNMGQGVWKKFKYLHRGTGTFAFRVPKPKRLRALLMETGPLVAPSANLQGQPPAKTVREAKKYFGAGGRARVDFYCDGGRLNGEPSTLVKLEKGKVTLLRAGAVRIDA